MGRADMKKKAKIAGARAAAVAKQAAEPNPFEMKTNRRKHAVVDNRKKKNQFNVASARDK
jgi:hypothetical protein